MLKWILLGKNKRNSLCEKGDSAMSMLQVHESDISQIENEKAEQSNDSSENLKNGSSDENKLSPLKVFIWIFMFLLITVVLPTTVLYFLRKRIIILINWIQSQGVFGYIYFDLLMILWILLCLPSTAIEMASGFLFGFAKSLVVSIIAKTLGSFIAFLLGKYIFHKLIHRNLASSSRILRALDFAMKKSPFRILLLIRLAAMPIAVKNYGTSILDVSKRLFLVCTFLGGIPFTLAWSYFGAASSDLIRLFGGDSDGSEDQNSSLNRSKKNVEIILLVSGIVASLVFIFFIKNYTKKAIAEVHDAHEEHVQNLSRQGSKSARNLHQTPDFESQV